MFFRSKKVIGLDIGSSSIKMAELEVGRQGAKLTAFGIAPSPGGAIVYGDIHDADGLGATIRQIAHDFKIKRKNVAVGLAGTAVIVKKITIPRIDKKLLREQVRWEAEQYIPFDVNSISLDYHLIDLPANSDMMELLLIASQNDVVVSYGNVVRSAGMTLGVLDVTGFALANAFELNYGKLPGQTMGLLNIGATTTNFVVVHDGETVFSRDINIGGQNYTYEIHKELGVSVPEAEALKISAIRGEGVPDEVHSLISATNETVKEEIRNNFDYFAGLSANLTLSQCFYTGGASGTPGLVESISQATSVRMDMLNPFQRVTANSKDLTPAFLSQVAPLASVALGLGMRKAGDS